MSDKTDPRLDAAKGWAAEDWEQELRNEGITFADDAPTERAQDMLADLDDADRAAGIVRVDTNDETLVERLAAIVGRSAAREVLAALREAS